MSQISVFQCPEGCSCFHDSQWTVNTIQCSGRGHTDVPALIPMDATEVFLDGNNMTELVNPGFIGRRRIRSVFLNSSMIRVVTNFSLEGLTDVRVLHLEDNQIELLSGNEFTGLTSLKELYLHNNYITTIGSGTFSSLRSLSVLRLDGNLLSSFPVLELVANPMLVGLYMAGNVWTCDCDFLQPFLALQRRLGSKIIDRNDLKCISSNFRNEAITAMESVPCANDDPLVDSDFQAHQVSQLDYTPILVSVLLAVLMIVVGYLRAFTFHSSIKEWLDRQTKGTDNNHIYHTLDPGGGSSSNLYLQYQPAVTHHQQLPNRVYINADLQVTPLTSQIQPLPSFQPGLQRALPAPTQASSHPGSQHRPQLQSSSSRNSSPEQQPINHTHSNSTSSAKRLLSPEDSEYIV